MNDQLSMSGPTTCEVSAKCTCLQGLEDGPLPCDSLGGLTLAQFGQALAPANLSASQARDWGMLTSGIYGQHGSTSLASASLASSLVNKLKQRFGTDGSTLFKLTWKDSATPSGRPVSLLRASAHRISDSGCGSSAAWPSPTLPSGGQVWPDGTSATGRRPDGSKATVNLENVARLASWPTPMAGTPAQNGNNPAGNTDYSRRVVDLASWATPNCPMAHDSDASAFRWNPNKKQNDPVMQIIGRSQSLSDVPTEKRAQLNPAFSLWLMGYQVVAWLLAAPSTKPSPRSRKQK